MGTRVLHDTDDEQAVLYDSVTGWAFGPVLNDERHDTAADAAHCFLKWLPSEPRTYGPGALEFLYGQWLADRDGGPLHHCGACYEPDDQPVDMSGATRDLNGHR